MTCTSHSRAPFPWHSKMKLLPTQVLGLCLIFTKLFPQQQEKLNHIRASSLFKSFIDFSIILKIEFCLLPGLQCRIFWTLQLAVPGLSTFLHLLPNVHHNDLKFPITDVILIYSPSNLFLLPRKS